MRRRLLLGLVAFAVLCSCMAAGDASPGIPPEVAAAQPSLNAPELAHQLRGRLTQIVQAEFGLNGPVARLAALAQVESAWRPQAQSKYAQGLTQFTPATAQWIAELRPELQPADPWDPEWSLKAAAYYLKFLRARVLPETMDLCDRWAMVLSGYNGGPGWVNRDRRLAAEQGADPDRWWGHVEKYSARADWAIAENRRYPRLILLSWEPRYVAAGWPGTPACKRA